jgi:hypothetical protein
MTRVQPGPAWLSGLTGTHPAPAIDTSSFAFDHILLLFVGAPRHQSPNYSLGPVSLILSVSGFFNLLGVQHVRRLGNCYNSLNDVSFN